MAAQPQHSETEREQRLDDALAAYFEAVDAGQVPSGEELLRRNPDLADDLRAFFVAEDEMIEHAEPLQPVARAARLELLDTEILDMTLQGAQSSALSLEPGTFGDYNVIEKIAEGAWASFLKPGTAS